MKRVLNLLLITVFAAALMQAYRAHVELRTSCEALEWQLNNKTQQLDTLINGFARRMRLDRQNAAQLETVNRDKASRSLNRFGREVTRTNLPMQMRAVEKPEN